MSAPLFIDSLKIQDGHFVHPEQHLRRIQSTQREVFGKPGVFLLTDSLIPKNKRRGVFKCRITYDHTIRKTEFIPYIPRQIRSLKVVDGSTVDYHLKYADRTALLTLLAQKEDCDDILIIRNGLVTDTSYSNVALYDGREFVTPRHPLLNGTQRQHLLSRGILREADVPAGQLPQFRSIHLINAMLDLEDRIFIKSTDVKI